ncbi:response regulator [candidate division KSB1 bacterium]|nr:response regulator [candidate division KSB1 bacterium]
MSKDILPNGNESIFIIDDEKALLLLLKKLFTRLGYEVFVAADGETAETTFREHWNTIQLIVLDQYLNNYDGMQLLKKFKKIKPEIKVILTSGFTIDEEYKKLESSIIEYYLQKPYNVEQLAKTVRKVLDT